MGMGETLIVALAIICATLVVTLGLAVWYASNVKSQDNREDNR